MSKKLDCLFLVVSSSKDHIKIVRKILTIEPPTWALLLAQSTRSFGYKINILDTNAEQLNEKQILQKLKADPKLICFMVMDKTLMQVLQMSGAVHVSNYLKNVTILIIVYNYVQTLQKKL